MRKFIFIFSACLILVSCTRKTTVYLHKSKPDYNQRITIQQPRFKRHLSVPGILTTAGATVGGGILGGQMEIIQYNQAEHQPTTDRMLNTAVGALAGYGIASAGNYLIAGQGRIEPPSAGGGLSVWARKFSRKYVLLGGDAGLAELVHRDAESSFEVRNIKDCRDFAAAFPASTREEQVVSQAANVLSRTDLPEVLVLFPQTSQASAIKTRYAANATTLEAAIEAAGRYPTHAEVAERRGAALVVDIPQAARFMEVFPRSEFRDELDARVVSTVRSIDQAALFLSTFPRSANKDELQRLSLATLSSVSQLMQFLEHFPDKTHFHRAVVLLLPKLDRSEYPGLIASFPRELFTREIKQAYVRTAPDVQALLSAGEQYKDHGLALEPLAAALTTDLLNADDYLRAFPRGASASAVRQFMRTTLKESVAALKSSYEQFVFLEKHQSVRYDPDKVLEALDQELERNRQYYRDKYFDLTENGQIPASNKLVLIKFETEDYPAWLALDQLEKVVQVNDYVNPWVTRIHTLCAHGNQGYILGEWYKEGIDGDILGALSNEVKQFESKTYRIARQNYPDLKSYSAKYFGSRDDDRRDRGLATGGGSGGKDFRVLKGSNDCNVQSRSSDYVFIYVWDGGDAVTGPNVKKGSYQVTYASASDKKKTTSDPMNDSSMDVFGTIRERDLPMKLTVHYIRSGGSKSKVVEVEIYSMGMTYDINLN